MCSDDSGVETLNSNLGVIHDLTRQQPMVKTITSFPLTIQTIKLKIINKKISTKNLKKKAGGTLRFFNFFARNFYGIFML